MPSIEGSWNSHIKANDPSQYVACGISSIKEFTVSDCGSAGRTLLWAHKNGKFFIPV